MIKPFITVDLDKGRNLRFTSRSVKQLEEIFNMTAIKYLKDVGTRMEDIKVDEYVTLLYLSLLWEDKELTKDKCYDLWDIAMEKNGFDQTIENLITSLSNYFGIEKEKQEELAGKTKALKKK